MAGGRARNRDFARYPKYKDNYIRAFDRMITHTAALGKRISWKTGEEVFRWWMAEPGKMAALEGQMDFAEYYGAGV